MRGRDGEGIRAGVRGSDEEKRRGMGRGDDMREYMREMVRYGMRGRGEMMRQGYDFHPCIFPVPSPLPFLITSPYRSPRDEGKRLGKGMRRMDEGKGRGERHEGKGRGEGQGKWMRGRDEVKGRGD